MSANPLTLLRTRTYLRKFGKVFATIFLTCIVSIGVIFGVTKFFTIRTIEVEGAGVQVVVDQKKLAKNLLFFPSEQLRLQLLSANPLLGNVEIHKKFPHTLVIVAFLRTPIGRLQSNNRLVDLDKDGVVVKEGIHDDALPLLIFDVTPIHIGDKMSDVRIVQSLAALSAFQSFVKIDTITSLDSQSLQVKFGKTSIYITQNENIQEIAATLQTLLAGFRIKGTLPTIIDLRFTKPVVSF